MEYLVTYYIKNTNDAKEIFNIVPYKSSVVTGSEDYVLELIASKLKKFPYFRCCGIMEHSAEDPKSNGAEIHDRQSSFQGGSH